MSESRQGWFLVVVVALAGGCVSPVAIREHRFTVSDLRDTAATQLESELKKDGVNVRRVDSQAKGSILGDRIGDYTFVISDPDYTDRDMAKVTERVTNPKREDPIVLRSTTVEQRYVSASGDGTARVELRVDLTENAKAFYKKTGTQIALRRTPGQQTATFDYQRKSREEYIDIYVVPDYAEATFKPKTFLRISLSHPYATQRLRWDPWYVRLWKALFGEKK